MVLQCTAAAFCTSCAACGIWPIGSCIAPEPGVRSTSPAPALPSPWRVAAARNGIRGGVRTLYVEMIVRSAKIGAARHSMKMPCDSSLTAAAS